MLRLRDFKIKQGETFEFNGNRITLLDFDNTPQHPDYQKQEGDIAVAAQLQIVAPDGSSHKAWPVYCIRGREVINLPYFVKEIGLHVNLQNILPSEQSMIFVLAQPNNDKTPIPVEIAENAARSDYIVLEAIIFPGINFVWIGSIMMMLGLGIALWRRLNSRQ
jgi:cytochrome c-type biogenesis protein CcmF